MQDVKYTFISPYVSKETIEIFKKYIDNIYESKVYSNSGKFAKTLEDIFSSRVEKKCVLAANATLILDAIHHFFRKETMSLPLFTFPATNLGRSNSAKTSYADCGNDGIAVHESGYDVCITTIPFGNPKAEPKRPECKTWIVDAAAGLDPDFTLIKRLLAAGANLVICSLHATKTLIAGEGGVAWGDESLIQRLKTYQNFGFLGSVNNRSLSGEGSNHKMSEFAAAFCLAYMDRDFFSSYEGKTEMADAYEEFFTCADFNFIYSFQAFWFLSKTDSSVLCERLREEGIEARRYYQPISIVNTWTNAQKMSEYGVCLPTRKFTQVERDDIFKILKRVLCKV